MSHPEGSHGLEKHWFLFYILILQYLFCQSNELLNELS